jgi:hypothetical protein
LVVGLINGFVCLMAAGGAVCGEWDASSATGGLVSHDSAFIKDFATPDATKLAPMQRPG